MRSLAALVIPMALAAAACSAEGSVPRAEPLVVVSIVEQTTTTTSIPPLEARSPIWASAAADPSQPARRFEAKGVLRGLRLELVTAGLDSPVWAGAPRNDDRLFVAEKSGKVWIFEHGRKLPRPFLDITGHISADHLERGLLGMAFHPDFWKNGRVFAFFTDPQGAAVVVEFAVAERNAQRVDTATARTLLRLEQFHPAHQGGSLAFGSDGLLFIGVGDGGIESDGNGGITSDPQGNGQDPLTLHGSILRIDVDHPPPDGGHYTIPADNPFVDDPQAAPEVWAFGLRNPWRLTIDPQTGYLYIADVGYEDWEEINVATPQTAGANYGWPVKEGTECFEAQACVEAGLTDPTLGVFHERACAIIGGPVYWGRDIPELAGHYFYGDYCLGWVRSMRYQNGEIVEEITWDALSGLGNLTSFGTDGHGEMYAMNLAGELYRIAPIRPTSPPYAS